MTVRRIAAVQGASNRVIQTLLIGCARRWSEQGTRVVGVVETFDEKGPRARLAARLQNLTTADTYPVFQDLGPLAAACHLDSAGVVRACAAVCRDIDGGCELVVLSKFGQLESLRSGLMDAFAAAIAHDAAVLTAVSPSYCKAWEAFTAPLSTILEPNDDALEAWWRAVRR